MKFLNNKESLYLLLTQWNWDDSLSNHNRWSLREFTVEWQVRFGKHMVRLYSPLKRLEEWFLSPDTSDYVVRGVPLSIFKKKLTWNSLSEKWRHSLISHMSFFSSTGKTCSSKVLIVFIFCIRTGPDVTVIDSVLTYFQTRKGAKGRWFPVRIVKMTSVLLVNEKGNTIQYVT